MSIFNRIFGGTGDGDESDRDESDRAEGVTAVEGMGARTNGRSLRADTAPATAPPEVSISPDDVDDLDDPLTQPDALPPPLPPPPGEPDRSPREALLSPPRTVGGVKVAPKRAKPRPPPVPGGTPPRPTARAPKATPPRRPAATVKSATPPAPAASPPSDGAVRRKRMSSSSGAFAAIIDEGSNGTAVVAGTSSESDRAAVQQVFDELATNHVDQVRNVMLELQVGDVACSWMETSKATLASLRAMASEMDNGDLVAALDGFVTAIDAAVASGQATVAGPRKDELMKRYERLVELIPRAFALDGERDRREPIIVESLLRQVPGVEKITIDRLFAAGLSRLNVLIKANAGDMSAAAGIAAETAARIVDRMKSYRSSLPTTVAAQDAAAEQSQLLALVGELTKQHQEYESAAAGWSDDHRKRKRTARSERERIFLEVRVVLARLGEVERLAELEKHPFKDRIRALTTYLGEVKQQRPPAARHSRARTLPGRGPSLGT